MSEPQTESLQVMSKEPSKIVCSILSSLPMEKIAMDRRELELTINEAFTLQNRALATNAAVNLGMMLQNTPQPSSQRCRRCGVGEQIFESGGVGDSVTGSQLLDSGE